MLKGKILRDRIHKEITKLHPSDKILITNRSYPLNTRSGDAEKIIVSTEDGKPTVPYVLEEILKATPIKRAEIMKPDTNDNAEEEVYEQFREVLGDIPIKEVGRYDFFDNASDMPVRLAIGTGDYRDYANILLTVGGEEVELEERDF